MAIRGGANLSARLSCGGNTSVLSIVSTPLLRAFVRQRYDIMRGQTFASRVKVVIQILYFFFVHSPKTKINQNLKICPKSASGRFCSAWRITEICSRLQKLAVWLKSSAPSNVYGNVFVAFIFHRCKLALCSARCKRKGRKPRLTIQTKTTTAAAERRIPISTTICDAVQFATATTPIHPINPRKRYRKSYFFSFQLLFFKGKFIIFAQ